MSVFLHQQLSSVESYGNVSIEYCEYSVLMTNGV